MFKRGHTVKFRKPFIERLNNIQLLIIEQEEIGYVRNVFENEIQLKITSKDMAITLNSEVVDDYIYLVRS